MYELTRYTAMLKELKNIAGDETCPMNIAADIYQCVDEISDIDVAPISHGYWYVGYLHKRMCGCCGHPDNDPDDFPHPYCPNCGAKMDREKPD